MVDFCKVRILSRNRQHFTVFYRVASKISPKHLNRFLCHEIRGVSVRKESSDAARRRPYLFTAHRLIMARRWRQCDRFLSYEQWLVSDEIWHKNRRNRFLGLERWTMSSESRDVCVQRPKFLLTQISIPIAVVLHCPFKISSPAVAVYLHRPMQYICSEKAMRCPDKVTALHPFTHRIVFAHAPHCVFSFTAHCSLLIAHNSSLRPPQQSSIRRLSRSIHADLCRARVII